MSRFVGLVVEQETKEEPKKPVPKKEATKAKK